MPVTFAVIASTVLVSGLLAVPLVRRLGLEQRAPEGVLQVGAGRVGRILAQALLRHDVNVLVIDSDLAKVEEVRRNWPFLRDRRIDAYDDLARRFRD